MVWPHHNLITPTSPASKSSCSRIILCLDSYSSSLVPCSQTRTSITSPTANFMKDTDFGTDVQLHSNRSKHTSEACMTVVMLWSCFQYYCVCPDLSMALMSPSNNESMSSSIIRELSSNMLIPYTRLKLLELVGQGT